ncbi:cob(I)yrinic acid a,c-diamide adenosyltransferase [Lachnoclostridium phytofermentans]|uniref:ATP:corrinoid adenosyltransferase BtuR/CobO/CobP n=1 Tax=Lachnoclostridium phytofermentans (strain ATCC 700394 / DSM 18823 / ISDg) TaxID=357809 RepID=A9KP94_LACP7|nr:cob(I)yrinic acid a,c-diamide adenosyltransferase [Lachnoclostridium phytofermentans]ABX41756.1 ATP:corrinoid adenosyltransferase BtuR/CobO/CobP [Lachnoclostridium phytofermentans ISDg]
MRGLIHIYAGDGKGKTTASIGLSVRCAGSGGDVVFAQFIKNNQSSELNILKQLPNIQVITCDKTFGFISKLTESERLEAKKVYSDHFCNVIKQVKSKDCKMLVLDEIIGAYNYNVIDRQELIDFLKSKPESLEVILTGRNPAKELLDMADYVSEIKKIKHPFDQGICARIGIEK